MKLTQLELEEIIQFIQDNNLTITYKIGWENFTRNVRLLDVPVFSVHSVAEQQLLFEKFTEINNRRIKNKKKIFTFRNVAGGNEDIEEEKEYSKSYSQRGQIANVLVQQCGNEFKKMRLVDETTVEMTSGWQLGKSDKELYVTHNATLAENGVPVIVSLLDKATIAGFFANNCAGTGVYQHSSGYYTVKAMELMQYTGKTITLDRNAANTESDKRKFKVITAAHLGLYGSVTKMRLECITPAVNFEYSEKICNIPVCRDEILNDFFLKHNAAILIMPQGTRKEATDRKQQNANVSMVSYKPVDKESHPVTGFHPDSDRLQQEIQVRISRLIDTVEKISEFPHLTPEYLKIAAFVAFGGEKENISIVPSYGTHSRHAYPADIFDSSYFVTVKSKKDIEEILNKVTFTIDQFTKRQRYPIIFGIYFRLIKSSENGCGFSSTQGEEGSFKLQVDFVSHERVPGFTEYMLLMHHYLVNVLLAMPHYGKRLITDMFKNNMSTEVDMDMVKAIGKKMSLEIPELDKLIEMDYEKLIGPENFAEGKEVLAQWYEDQGLRPEHNPFMTYHYTNMLKCKKIEANLDTQLTSEPDGLSKQHKKPTLFQPAVTPPIDEEVINTEKEATVKHYVNQS